MIQNLNQYEAVKEILVEKAAKQRKDRTTIKTRKWYAIILELAMDKFYIDFSYEEFYEIFKKEVLNGSFADRKFHIKKEGFLDFSEKEHYAEILIEYTGKKQKKIS